VALAIASGGWLSLRADRTLRTFDFGEDPGPALVPRLLLIALAVGGLLLAGHGLRRMRGRRRRDGGGPGWGALALPTAFVASLAAYLAALPRLGYRVTTLLFCLAWIAALSGLGRDRLTPRDWAVAIASAGLVTGSLYYVFRVFVRVPLP
jgi:hypothetical protein